MTAHCPSPKRLLDYACGGRFWPIGTGGGTSQPHDSTRSRRGFFKLNRVHAARGQQPELPTTRATAQRQHDPSWGQRPWRRRGRCRCGRAHVLASERRRARQPTPGGRRGPARPQHAARRKWTSALGQSRGESTPRVRPPSNPLWTFWVVSRCVAARCPPARVSAPAQAPARRVRAADGPPSPWSGGAAGRGGGRSGSGGGRDAGAGRVAGVGPQRGRPDPWLMPLACFFTFSILGILK